MKNDTPPAANMVRSGETGWQSIPLALKTCKVRHTIQCVHPDTGETGCWIYVGPSLRLTHTAVSPVFSDLMDLFTYARDNGITIEHSVNPGTW